MTGTAERVELPVYLDHAASTPVDPAVADAIDRCLRDPRLAANPSAEGHAPGRAAQALVESCRAPVADLVGGQADGVIWTSGATESDNLAILGVALDREARGRHLVTALTEHKAVIESCRHLARRGWRVTWLRPDAAGRIPPGAVADALVADTVLVSIMQVNNETGVVNDVAAIGALCRARDVPFHVDAAQGAGRVPLNMGRDGIDLLSLSAHKLGGPKGVGALVLDRARVPRVAPLLHGGGQELGLRPGTVPTHQVVGMAEAFRLARERAAADGARIEALRDRLWAALGGLPGILLNGEGAPRAPHILNVSVEGVEGESLLHALKDLAVASGSACTSATGEPSYVLRALGRSAALAQASVRFSLGRTTTAGEIDFAADALAAAVARLRAFSPAWPPAMSRP